ncbi:MAG: 2-amino-4-hydroxy-6-hydroxymethyldihydropteridine diphosphokinase [Nitrospirae bacterium]|nr:2-amino-4-hydroxy-6-hydroxymethyldihydropteridine diphosphokinase [Nitrospirota bacterium]
MSTVYLGIGSNLGDRVDNCKRAIELLKEEGIIIQKESSIYETEPWGVKEQPIFVNMVIEAETVMEPFDLLRVLKNIEKKMGRKETFHWGPRIIDLDILLYDNMVINNEKLNIPHKNMHERYFVLKPLSEIAGDIRHPVLQLNIKELLQRIKK